MNFIKLYYKMDTIFSNSRKSKTSESYRLLPNLTDEKIKEK